MDPCVLEDTGKRLDVILLSSRIGRLREAFAGAGDARILIAGSEVHGRSKGRENNRGQILRDMRTPLSSDLNLLAQPLQVNRPRVPIGLRGVRMWLKGNRDSSLTAGDSCCFEEKSGRLSMREPKHIANRSIPARRSVKE